jgi:adenylate cyclase
MNSHIQAMMKVEAGDTEQHVPILTRDEFGLMAHQTNQLILQLQNREHFIEGMEELIHEQEQLIQEKDQLRQTLEKIVSPNILEKLLTTDDQTLKQGQEYDVAILFCDLREFTNFTETSSAEDVIFFLNSYFSEIVRIVSDHHGLVNKFMGDAILAVYGLEESPTPVDDAVNASWAILRHAQSIQTPGGEHMDIGIGIHYGQVMAGTIGSAERFEYTFIGDAVNTASRLDGLSKRLGHKIIISRKAYMELAEETREKFTDLDKHTLRGKKEPVHVYGAVTSEKPPEL